jgi:hypothetical protein
MPCGMGRGCGCTRGSVRWRTSRVRVCGGSSGSTTLRRDGAPPRGGRARQRCERITPGSVRGEHRGRSRHVECADRPRQISRRLVGRGGDALVKDASASAALVTWRSRRRRASGFGVLSTVDNGSRIRQSHRSNAHRRPSSGPALRSRGAGAGSVELGSGNFGSSRICLLDSGRRARHRGRRWAGAGPTWPLRPTQALMLWCGAP